MDKSWILIGNRALPQYLNGVELFLNFAFSNLEVGVRIQCPCIKCNNVLWKTRDEVRIDLCRFGMNQTYKKWIHHGELDLSSDDETNLSEDSSLEIMMLQFMKCCMIYIMVFPAIVMSLMTQLSLRTKSLIQKLRDSIS